MEPASPCLLSRAPARRAADAHSGGIVQTTAGGIIHLELGVVLKDFSKFNVRYN
jgi:hypothetical protein